MALDDYLVFSGVVTLAKALGRNGFGSTKSIGTSAVSYLEGQVSTIGEVSIAYSPNNPHKILGVRNPRELFLENLGTTQDDQFFKLTQQSSYLGTDVVCDTMYIHSPGKVHLLQLERLDPLVGLYGILAEYEHLSSLPRDQRPKRLGKTELCYEGPQLIQVGEHKLSYDGDRLVKIGTQFVDDMIRRLK